MHHLVIGALQEGRIDGAEGLHAFRRQARGEGHPMLLGDAHIEAALGECLLEQVHAGARGHRRGDGDDAVVLFGFRDQAFGEHLLVGWAPWHGLLLLAGEHGEFRDRVIFVGAGFGRGIALALLGHHMHQDRTLHAVAHILQHRDQMIEIVAVDRADIEEAHLLEQRAAHGQAARIFLGAARHVEQRARQEALGQPFAQIAEARIGPAGDQPRQIGAHRPHRRGDRHVVVVEDDDQPVLVGAGIVHRLIGHARAHRAVADHGDDIVVAALEIARRRHAQAGRDRGRGMRRAERVIFAFGALGEAGQAAALAQGAHARAPAGDDLVRIGLMADVPDQTVSGVLNT